ncbi:hypothetical protein KHC23_07650 [Ancylobacter dichloromethanicus]|uniref:Uncharacterized protein n=1 Tax=Ancylobacter dichloromethanicus TaxID=518825 RepID=A0A9W6JBG9_9HYPH|nr:hypothetical protein [Ancylobacter dichloromethanicus]MBS7553520.1 hypothetical protein [Ancylobacter dichloromethanicus]GLK72578.1 hypothetical protein GCM10017643_26940 [Ancylobacter dichloromethanicus]
MGEPSFQVLGEVARVDKDRAAPFFLLTSLDGNEAVLARRDGDAFFPVTGPVTLEYLDRLATNVLAGNPRANTAPEALKQLALGFASLVLQLRRAGCDAANPMPDATPPAPGEAPHAPGCTPHAHAVPTQESGFQSGFTCTPCGG